MLDRGRPLDEALDGAPGIDRLDPRDRAFVRVLVATALRRRGEIDGLLAARLSEPLASTHPRARAALRIGVAQLVHLATPAHAAVSATVDTLSDRAGIRFKGLVNAVLRRIAREAPAPLDGPEAARANTPDWLWSRWSATYGEAATAAIGRAHLGEPPLDLTARDDPRSLLEALGADLLATGSLRLRAAGPVTALPGFGDGAWWVQDAAAAIPARLFGDVRGRSAIDLCAAPGGKTAQLAATGARVTAVDISPRRSAILRENLDRLRLAATIVVADANQWRPDAPADLVLVDAPCSATGTIRRHPDIPHLRTAADLTRLVEVQDRLLDAAVAMARPGGTIVFATCSLEAEEGRARVDALLARGAPVALDPIAAAELPGLPEAIVDGMLRTLPSMLADAGGMDGFFAARLRRLPGA